MEFKTYSVYLLTNKNNSVIYTGMTNNLHRRIAEHKQKIIPGFTKRYSVDKLVYYEFFDDPSTAIAREKQIKAGSREKKDALINGMNPGWDDLYSRFTE
ncbi:MAG: GIY-YIG nuclease family protein [Candidatus Kapaibacterium sp.]